MNPHSAVELRLHGRRLWLYNEALNRIHWERVERLLWMRRIACAECPLLRRWFGVWWCGSPMPLRVLQVLPLVMWAILAAVGVVCDRPVAKFEWQGCGCNLDLKWTVLYHPMMHVRSAFNWLVKWTVGVELSYPQQIHNPLTCPRGRWPVIVGGCPSG